MKKTFMGVKLRTLRAERGLSQIALAHTLGLSPSYLNQLEQNQRPLTVSVLLKLHKALGVDVQQFSEDEESRLMAGLREAKSDAAGCGGPFHRERPPVVEHPLAEQAVGRGGDAGGE